MLKELMKKYFNPASAETQEEVEMTQETEQTVLAADNTAVDMAAQLEVAMTTLAAKDAAFTELAAKYAEVEAALAQSAEAQATLVANAKAAVLATRTASLSAIMGDVKGPLLAASLESLDDATFATVLSGYAASFEAEENSEMFSEVGVAAEATPVVEVDTVTQLAASIAAKFQPK